ncbi:unnamed protein product, partial [Phaeothamnion confervicola]
AAVEPAVQPQFSNQIAKADRLPVVQASSQPSFQLASVDTNYVPAPAPRGLRIDPEKSVEWPAPMALAPTTPEVVTAPARVPVAAPKRAAVPPENKNAILDESQIASIKQRLRLTEAQIEYWPAVEAALLDVVRKQARSVRNRHNTHAAAPQIDVNSAEVQSLVWAAMPLLMRLREDQKKEVRQLARVLGLESVASQI